MLVKGATWAHVANDFSIGIQIRGKFHSTYLIKVVVKWSLWNFAHGVCKILSDMRPENGVTPIFHRIVIVMEKSFAHHENGWSGLTTLYRWLSARKTYLTPLLTHWSYIFLALTHRYDRMVSWINYTTWPTYFVFVPHIFTNSGVISVHRW